MAFVYPVSCFQFAKRMRFFCLFILCLLISCFPDPIELKLKNQSPKLVVNTDLIPGELPVINLTQTMDIVSGIPTNNDTLKSDLLKKIAVSDANVTISYAAYTDTLYMMEPGVYGGRKPLQISDAPYQLHVKDTHSDMELSAQSFLLPKTKFDTIFPMVYEDAGDTSIYINYGFVDIATGSGYYMVNCYVKKKTVHEVNFDSRHFFERGYNQLFYTQLIRKEDFYDHYFQNFVILPEDITVRDSIAVSLTHISEAYYNYLVEIKYTGGGLFFYFFPTYLKGNVANGLGYFNVGNPDVFFSDLK